MAQYQVTIDSEILQHLFVRDDGLARLVEQVVNQILETQATEQLKAKPYERTPDNRVIAMATGRNCLRREWRTRLVGSPAV